MKRTQLYLDDDLWTTLHVLARQSGTTLSELVRQAARETYMRGVGGRREALCAAAGLWRNRRDLPSTTAYVRGLRKGERLNRTFR